MPVYKDTYCNRIANRVGKEYGSKKKPKPKIKPTTSKPFIKMVNFQQPKKIKFIVDKK